MKIQIRLFTRLWLTPLVASALWACVPQDVAIPLPGPSASPLPPSYSGFTGAIKAETVSPTKIKLSWNPSYDPTVAAYNIYDVTAFFDVKLIKTVKAPASFITVNNLLTENFYTFRVRASDSTNKEDTNTSDVSAIPYGGITLAEVQTSTSARLTFNDGSNADSIKVYCKTDTNPAYQLMRSITNVALLQTTLTGLTSGANYTCRADLAIGGFEDNNLSTVAFTPMGQASQLVFSTQPGSGAAGTALGIQPVVTITDTNGNVVTSGPDANIPVTLGLSVNSPSAGTVRGSATVTAAKGIATFSGLFLQEAGTKIIGATKPDTSGQVFGSAQLTVDSTAFVVAPGAVSASLSQITINPAGPLIADGTATYTVTIKLADQYGNPITGIKPQFASTEPSDSLTQPSANTGSAGTITGSLQATLSGNRTLNITSPSGLSGVTVPAVFNPGPANKLGFTLQPSNSPAGSAISLMQVAIQDSKGNTVIADSTTAVTLAISSGNNPGNTTLQGTVMATAASGIASFGLAKIPTTGSNYKLVATSDTNLLQQTSNAFNVTSGGPTKILILAPAGTVGTATIKAGQCSGVAKEFTVELLDNGNNLAPPTSGTTKFVNLTGMGTGKFYSTNSCGTQITSFTFSPGTSSAATKKLYLMDNKAESLTLSATENTLVTATLPVLISPSQMSLTAPTQALSGTCIAIPVTTKGADSVLGNVGTDTPFLISGSLGSAKFYLNSGNCGTGTGQLNPSTDLKALAGTNTTTLYLKDNTAEALTLSISDPAGNLLANGAQSLSILPSKLALSGPTSLRAGECSATAFTLTIQDAAGNPVNVTSGSGKDVTLNGLGTNGQFFGTAGCVAGSGVAATVNIPQGSPSTTVYLKAPLVTAPGVPLPITVSDPASSNAMATSAANNVVVWPASLAVTVGVASANTGACAGPFTVTAKNFSATTSAFPSALAVTLGGSQTGGVGNGGFFYSDPACIPASKIAQLSFSAGDNSKPFYYSALYPGNPVLTATGTPSGPATPFTGSLTYPIKAYPAFIGTHGDSPYDATYHYTFRQGIAPVRARVDAPSAIEKFHFATSAATGKRWLLASEYSGGNKDRTGRIHLYDYGNNIYAGWIGPYSNIGTIPLNGSYFADLNSTGCNSGTDGVMLAGWCRGGAVSQSWFPGQTSGRISYPTAIADDGTYFFVIDRNFPAILRYRLDTSISTAGSVDDFIAQAYGGPATVKEGGFSGWIGQVNDPNMACKNAQPPVVGTYTPSWCYGGAMRLDGNGYGLLYGASKGNQDYPTALAYGVDNTSNGYLYVGTNKGAVYRFDSNGTFQGWVGRSTTGALSTWGTTGVPSQSNANGGLSVVHALYVDASTNTLAVIDAYYAKTTIFNLTDGTLRNSPISYPGGSTAMNGITNDWATPTQVIPLGTGASPLFATAFRNRLQIFNPLGDGSLGSWIGKTSSGSNTSIWTNGPNYAYGFDEQSFSQLSAVEYDSVGGFILTGEGSQIPGAVTGGIGSPAIKKWNATTGAYVGSLAQASDAVSQWNSDSTAIAQFTPTGDDSSLTAPMGSYVDAANHLYVLDSGQMRIKKYDVTTGNVLGWLGSATTTLAGGNPCGGNVSSFSFTNAWCLASIALPWLAAYNSIQSSYQDPQMYSPSGITSDGTYVYVTDSGDGTTESIRGGHRIVRYKVSDGSYQGWIGGIAPEQGPLSNPPDGQSNEAQTCVGATGATPGWCTGGKASCGSISGGICPGVGSPDSRAVWPYGDGHLAAPAGIYYDSPSRGLYVVDVGNSRVAKFDAPTGAFVGWIGKFHVNSGGCIAGGTGSKFTAGWCKATDSSPTNSFGLVNTDTGENQQTDSGGGFSFHPNSGITGDSMYLYVSNDGNNRVDRFSITLGTYGGSLDVSTSTVSPHPANLGVWTSTPSWINHEAGLVVGLWNDGVNLYSTVLMRAWVGNSPSVSKWNLSTGAWLGWKGAYSGASPATSATGWYQGAGTAATSLTLPTLGQGQGGFFPNGLLGISGDANYVYVSDRYQNRVVRITK